MNEKLSKLAGLKKSWTMYFAALLMASPDLLAFLPTIKDNIPPDWYPWLFRAAIAGFVLLRIKTQIQK